MPSLQVAEDISEALDLEGEETQRLVLAAQVMKLVGSRLSLAELKKALAFLASEDSPLDRALSWTVADLERQAESTRRSHEP